MYHRVILCKKQSCIFLKKDAWSFGGDEDAPQFSDDYEDLVDLVATTPAPQSSPPTGEEDGDPDKPHLKIGIVLPKRIFKRRQYREVISRTLSQVLGSEYCTSQSASQAVASPSSRQALFLHLYWAVFW